MLLTEVSRERGELQGERGELRSRLARLELERAQLEIQSQQLRESNQQLDLSACRLTTQCEVRHSVGGSLGQPREASQAGQVFIRALLLPAASDPASQRAGRGEQAAVS